MNDPAAKLLSTTSRRAWRRRLLVAGTIIVAINVALFIWLDYRLDAYHWQVGNEIGIGMGINALLQAEIEGELTPSARAQLEAHVEDGRTLGYSRNRAANLEMIRDRIISLQKTRKPVIFGKWKLIFADLGVPITYDPTHPLQPTESENSDLHSR